MAIGNAGHLLRLTHVPAHWRAQVPSGEPIALQCRQPVVMDWNPHLWIATLAAEFATAAITALRGVDIAEKISTSWTPEIGNMRLGLERRATTMGRHSILPVAILCCSRMTRLPEELLQWNSPAQLWRWALPRSFLKYFFFISTYWQFGEHVDSL